MEKNRKLSDAEAQHLEANQSDSSSAHEDAVFGKITEGGPNYRNVGWVGTAGLMMKTQIGLGVLSFPAAFDVLGLIPGIICLLIVATITTWSGYMVGVFKINHREVYGIDDAGFLMFGRAGKEILAGAYCLFYTFCAASALIGISIGLNAVSHHATCTAVFVVVGALVTFALASIRTLGKLTWLAWGGLICIIAAVLIVTFAVGFQDQPAAAPVPWTPDFKLFKNPPFHSAISAVSIMCFAYAGTPAFFALAAEMREPRHYVRSLALCQGSVTAIYIAVSTVVYYYCGSYVASPALGSAGNKMKLVAYGVSLPGLFVTATVLAHIPAKFVFVRVLRGSRHLTESTPTHWITWLGCTSGITIVAYVVASGIPIFEDLVSLVGALLGTVVSFQPMGCMWLYDNWKSQRTTKWKAMVCWSVFVIVAGTFLTIAGTYGSVVAIIDDKSKAGGSKVWSCADNSNST